MAAPVNDVELVQIASKSLESEAEAEEELAALSDQTYMAETSLYGASSDKDAAAKKAKKAAAEKAAKLKKKKDDLK